LLSISGSSDPSCVQKHMVKVGVTLWSKNNYNISSLVKKPFRCVYLF
jgi:hypothetical protein